ncbi:Hypothetical Protein FCC1311_051302 [Hondaea fermentalgiana]|uniref:Histone chaperone domain-containing protein n=1 Tax=Hondaea fermentalgiana TaxID=2315210 RepID=A0A2R5GF15_9STRA|nr:Hypothetical Protein FCC1311_051302 [Hondaea fermentalgiana]|eukprot:GBG28909.1 Hypothetical Protein FCC1311_051302 [Hondaea fermentalgiana]
MASAKSDAAAPAPVEDIERGVRKALEDLDDPANVSLKQIRKSVAKDLKVDDAALKAFPKFKEIVMDVFASKNNAASKKDNKKKDSAASHRKRERLSKGSAASNKKAKTKSSSTSSSDEDGEESGGESAASEDSDEVEASSKKKTTLTKKSRGSSDKRSSSPSPPSVSMEMTMMRKFVAAAGLAPAVYRDLPEDEADKLRELRIRAREKGFEFNGQYPKQTDVSRARAKRERSRDLEDIDTSNIISAPRSRRSSRAPRASLIESDDSDADDQDDDDDDVAADEEVADQGNEDDDEDEDEDEAAAAASASDDESDRDKGKGKSKPRKSKKLTKAVLQDAYGSDDDDDDDEDDED